MIVLVAAAEALAAWWVVAKWWGMAEIVPQLILTVVLWFVIDTARAKFFGWIAWTMKSPEERAPIEAFRKVFERK